MIQINGALRIQTLKDYNFSVLVENVFAHTLVESEFPPAGFRLGQRAPFAGDWKSQNATVLSYGDSFLISLLCASPFSISVI